MVNTVRETTCTHCIHRGVCKHQKDFLDVIDAVNSADVTWSEGNKGCMKRVTSFECVASIEVTCKFYKQEQPQNREGIF